jgi:predicted Zn-dependent protease
MQALRLGIFFLLLSVFLPSCATVNVPSITAEGDVLRMEKDEQELWKNAERVEKRIEKSGLLFNDLELEAYLNRVARKLLPEGFENNRSRPRIKVLKVPTLDAFSLPNGAICIHIGMLTTIDNEAQLAALLGHEMVHFINRHTLKQMRNTGNETSFLKTTQLILISTGLGALLVVPLHSQSELWALTSARGYSRELETEADEQGLKLAALANYDPEEGMRLYKHLLDNREPQKTDPFYSTHLPLEERIENLNRLLPKFKLLTKEQSVRREEFQKKIDPVLLESAAMSIEKGRYQVALAAINRKLATSPQNAKAHFLLGEWHRRGEGGNPDYPKKALAAYRESARLDPDYPQPHRELGLLLREQNAPGQARVELERYLALDPNAPDAPIIRSYVEELKKAESRQ